MSAITASAMAADPDADAGRPVLPALRLGQALDGIVVEAHPLLDQAGEGIGRALDLTEQLRDLADEAPDADRALGRRFEPRAGAELASPSSP